MKYLVTAEEMRRCDGYTISEIGIPAMVLMERAAYAALEVVEKRMSAFSGQKRSALIMAGTGNNGGDGLALARMLSDRGYAVEVWCVGRQEKASEQWKSQRKILNSFPVVFCGKPEKEEYTVIIDALFGVGLCREISGEFAGALDLFNALRGWKLALDLPSGVDSDTGKIWGNAVRADATVTFAFCKRGLALYPGCGFAGEVITADIGIPLSSFRDRLPGMYIMEEDLPELLPERNPAGNKGTFGKVLLVAGHRNMAGAAVLAARGAYRTGAGMVKVITPEDNRVILQTTVPEALLGTPSELEESLKWADVIAIGPGLGKDSTALRCLWQVINESRLPLLIDADGLNLLAETEEMAEILAKQGSQGREIVLTPHVGELSRLTGLSVERLKENLPEEAYALASQFHAVVAAKDARTFVCREGKPVCVSLAGNSGMATAGSGDVLAGMLAGLMAQGVKAWDAVCAGVRIHGIAGDRAAKVLGEHACMAGDLILYCRGS